MKPLLFTLLALVGTPAALFSHSESKPAANQKNCGCACCVGQDVCCCETAAPAVQPENTPEKEKPVAHPLTGVIVDLLPREKALLVKHDAIPGVMKAMTMMFRVEEAVLQSAAKGARLTGQLTRRGAVWWLVDVQFVTKE